MNIDREINLVNTRLESAVTELNILIRLANNDNDPKLQECIYNLKTLIIPRIEDDLVKLKILKNNE